MCPTVSSPPGAPSRVYLTLLEGLIFKFCQKYTDQTRGKFSVCRWILGGLTRERYRELKNLSRRVDGQ